MLCQCCGRNPASAYVKIVCGGKLTEYALCTECARQFGCGNLFAGLGYRMDDIVREFFDSEEEEEEEVLRCKCCGMSFSDIVRSGRVGCAECYTTFADRLLPVIRQIHGSDTHRGKVPGALLQQVPSGGKLAVRGSESGGEGKE